MAKIMASTAGAARSVIRRTMIGMSSVDTELLSLDGSLASKFGDRAADRSDCDRNNKPQMATRAHALKEDSSCIEKLL